MCVSLRNITNKQHKETLLGVELPVKIRHSTFTSITRIGYAKFGRMITLTALNMKTCSSENVIHIGHSYKSNRNEIWQME